MCPQGAHIAIKRRVYCYRRRLPAPLRGEILLSLRTTRFRLAQHLAIILDRVFEKTLSRSWTMQDQEDRLRAVLGAELRKALREELRRHQEAPAGTALFAHFADPGAERTEDAAYLDALISRARDDLARRSVLSMAEYAEELIQKHGLPSELERPLMFGLLRNRLQVLEAARRWLDTGPVEDSRSADEPGSRASSLLPAASSGLLPEQELPSVEASPRLSSLLEPFIDLMVRDQGWRGQTLAQNRATYRMFIEVAGDLPIRSYHRRHCGEFYELLRRLPALYAKNAAWKGLALREIAAATEGQDMERLSMKTLKRHFSALGRLFRYCIEQGHYDGQNPAHGFSFPQKGRPSQRREMWCGEKLRDLFLSPVWTGCRSKSKRAVPGDLIIQDDKYWLPLLGLFHGNRLEEFAQLRRSDVRCEDDVWYLDINDEGDKQVKNEQSKRRVPLHPEVLGLGFLDYVTTVAPNDSDPLFPDLEPGGADGKRGHSFTKWWTRYRKEVGLYEKGLDYHSFRHGVTTKLYDAGVPDVFVDELTGHEGQGTGRKHYLKDLSLPRLLEAISRVAWTEVDVELIKRFQQKNSRRL